MNIKQQVRRVLQARSNLLKNFVALGLVQATNFIIPLITFPYLTRTIGLEKFGVISYGLTILTFFIVFVEYGFNLSGTRLVSLYRGDVYELSKLFARVMATKFFLLILSILILIILCTTVTKMRLELLSYLLGSFYILGNVLMPTWFFQGLEEMKYITYANVVAKLIQIALIFLFIKSETDYIYVLALYGIANVVSGIYSISLAITKYKLYIQIPSMSSIWDELKSSWYFFSSNFSITVANSLNIFILGFFVSNVEIGYYSIVEKIIFVAWTMLGLFSQAVYPTVCKLALESYHKLFQFLYKLFIPVISMTALTCCCIYYYTEEIMRLILGYYNASTVDLLRIVIIIPFIVVLNIPAHQILLAYDYKKEYSAIFNVSAIVNVVLCTLLVYRWGVTGAALCMVIVQTLITLSLYILLFIKLKTSSRFTNFGPV